MFSSPRSSFKLVGASPTQGSSPVSSALREAQVKFEVLMVKSQVYQNQKVSAQLKVLYFREMSIRVQVITAGVIKLSYTEVLNF